MSEDQTQTQLDVEEQVWRIPLRNGSGEIVAYARVDEDNYEILSKGKWRLVPDGYAKGYIDNLHCLMHRYVMNVPKGGPIVDHINNDKLDNRKEFLRLATGSQNSQNTTKQEGKSSDFFGVCKTKEDTKWRCSIREQTIDANGIKVSKKITYFFEIEEHAAYCYDILALRIHGPGAKINRIAKPDGFVIPEIKEFNNMNIRKTVSGKYTTYIKFETKKINLGTHDSFDEAKEAYINKKKELEDERENRIKNSEILRNKDGIPVLEVFRKGEKFECLVDENRYHDLLKYSWTVSEDNYVKTTIDGVGTSIHRYVIGAKEGEIIDHVSGNRLDNRAQNLRVTSSTVNAHNRIKKENCSSDYIGVTYRKDNGNYRAGVTKEGKKHNFGQSKIEFEAALLYDDGVKKVYGDEAKLNFPDTKEGREKLLEARKEYEKKLIQINNEKMNKVQDIKRNVDGIAVIEINNKNKTKKFECLVDDDKYYDLIQYNWMVDLNNNNVQTKMDGKYVIMHRYLMDVKERGVYITHKSNNTLDNRLDNLIVVDSSIRYVNRTKKNGASSKYYGVYKRKTDGRYRVLLNKDGVEHSFGAYSDEKEAARKADIESKRLFGSNAKLNFPDKE